MRSAFMSDLRRSGKEFRIMRDGVTSTTVKGLVVRNDKYIAFPKDTDVCSRDWLSALDNPREEYLVTDTEIVRDQINCYFTTRFEHQNQGHAPSISVTANTITGSIIGAQTFASISLDEQLRGITEEIRKSDSPDKNELLQIIDLLQSIKSSAAPVQKGFLSNFSGAMERNSWITSAIASFLLNLFLRQ